jgi:methyl-accepting chemotaxis protein
MNQLSIRTRILAGFALPILLFVGFTFWFSGQLAQVKANMTQVSEQSVQYALLATAMDKNVVQIQQFLSDISATQGKDGLDDGFKRAQENYDEFSAGLARFDKHFAETGDATSSKQVQTIKADAAAYYATGQTMAQAFVAAGPLAGNKLMGGFDSASEQLQKQLAPFVKAQVDHMTEDLAASSAKTDQIARIGIIIVAVAVLVALLVAFVVTASITRPLARALGVARQVAAGRLDTDIVTDESEIGQLMAPLAKMKDTLLQFEAAQSEMARQHELGMLDYRMPVNQLEGDYKAMGESINSLVASHIAVTTKVVEVVSAYSAGRFEVAMDRLPGQKARISEALDKVQAGLKDAAMAAQRNLRIKTALDRCTTNVMIADTDCNIIYLNETVSAMMQRNEAELRKVLPQFDAKRLIGTSIDLFHKNPSHQRQMLGQLKQGYKTQIQVGSLHFSLSANPITDEQGQRLGTIVEWADRTAEVHIENEIAGVVDHASAGDFEHRLSVAEKSGFFATLSIGMNRLLDVSAQGLNDVAKVLAALADGDLSQRMTGDYAGLFAKVQESVNRSNDNLARVIGEVRAAADALTGAANQVSATAQSLSQAASQQASNVEETTLQHPCHVSLDQPDQRQRACHRSHGHPDQQRGGSGWGCRHAHGGRDETDRIKDWHRG